MPSSYVENVPDIVGLIKEADWRTHGLATVIDVGPGMGKYGVLCREHLPHLHHMDALEVWPPYLSRFRWLPHLYDRVFCQAMQRYEGWGSYQLVLLIDVIEHVALEAGVKVLQAIQEAGAMALVSTPRNYPQGMVMNNPYEAHLSEWTAADFRCWTGPSIVKDNDRSLIRLLL